MSKKVKLRTTKDGCTVRSEQQGKCTRLGRYYLSHHGKFQGRHICLARDQANQTYTCKRRTSAELNHIRKVMLLVGDISYVLPILNVINGASILDDSHTFQDEIKGSLSDIVARRGPLAETCAARIFRQVLACLHCCHSQGVIIKDLELDHFVLTARARDRVFLHDVIDCDVYHPDIDHEAPINPFIAPEVMMSSQHTPISNVWAAGVILYVLLTQHWPFFGNNKEELIQSIFSGHYFVHPSWSYELRHLLSCMLCVKPQKRLLPRQLLHHPWFRICRAVELSYSRIAAADAAAATAATATSTTTTTTVRNTTEPSREQTVQSSASVAQQPPQTRNCTRKRKYTEVETTMSPQPNT